MSDLRDRVRAEFGKRGVLQKTLAKEIGYSEAMVSLWLNDKIRSKNLETALELWLSSKAEQELATTMSVLHLDVEEAAVKEAATKVNAHLPLSSLEEFSLQRVQDRLTQDDEDLVLLNMLAFARMRPSLDPPVKPGEFIVVSDGKVLRRFLSRRDAAMCVIEEVKKDCYVHEEPRHGQVMKYSLDILFKATVSS